jgi:hypothetical protein
MKKKPKLKEKFSDLYTKEKSRRGGLLVMDNVVIKFQSITSVTLNLSESQFQTLSVPHQIRSGLYILYKMLLS